MSFTENPDVPARRRRNHLVWLGPVVAVAGAVSYFTFFARFPALRDVPWVNLPLVLLGVGLSAVGLWRAVARPRLFRGRIWGTIGMLSSLLLGALFGSYVFVISTWLPRPTETSRSIDVVPDVRLSDQLGHEVGLPDLAGRRVVLTFYRGYW